MILDPFDPRAWGPVEDPHQIVSVEWAVEASEVHLLLEVQEPRTQSSDAPRRRSPLVFPTGCNIGRGEIEQIVPDVTGVKSQAADCAVSPSRVVGSRPAMKLNQRPDRRPQRFVGIEAPQCAVRELGSEALVTEEMDLAIETDATG